MYTRTSWEDVKAGLLKAVQGGRAAGNKPAGRTTKRTPARKRKTSRRRR